MSIAPTLVHVAAGALSGVLSFGLYGYFRDKKRWGYWKAGAAAGAVGAAIGSLGWLSQRYFDGDSAMGGLTVEPLSGITIDSIPRSIAGLTISKLSGLQVNGLGLDDLQIGAVAVDPLTMQTIGRTGPMAGETVQLGTLWER